MLDNQPLARSASRCVLAAVMIGVSVAASAGVADPQVRTDHPWYPGELACSTFERLAVTQATMFERVTGRAPESDQDRVLAAWMWRNLHYAHGEEGKENLWGNGFLAGDTTTRDYWTGLFAHGFGLCGTTHAQWTAELNALLGHGRSRTVGVPGHNSCEVFLRGGPYGEGRWALLDHDVSTVVFDPSGSRLIAIDELARDLKRLGDPGFQPARQQGWPLAGLHPDDTGVFSQMNVVEHLPGYAGPPPVIHLRRGETLRRYFEPGLDDGKTFVFWGRNYRSGGIPGPERSRTWMNQPENFRTSGRGSGYNVGQARYGNAVYSNLPNFRDGSYREGVVSETDGELVLEFQTPFIIGATPPNDGDWGIYDDGGRNGLVVRSRTQLPLTVSVDRGQSWSEGVELSPGQVDFTDRVKGHRQYWLRVARSAARLVDSELQIVTVCQANPAMFPRLRDDGSMVSFQASGERVISAGPNRSQAEAHVVEGGFDSPRVTLELAAPEGRVATRVFAVGHVASSNPPDPRIAYQIEYSADGGGKWTPIVRDWRIVRQGNEPTDFWSQSFCYGDAKLPDHTTRPIRVRFHNSGGKRYLRAEVHLTCHEPASDNCRVTFAWSDDREVHRTATHDFSSNSPDSWTVPTGKNVTMHWVEYQPAP